VRYWWVNQNQTYRQEIAGGYLWSPKRNANGVRNPFYEFMKEVAPGDLVFSFVDTRIAAIGTVASYCYESPKPAEFGGVGLNWEAIGWRVRVNFVSLLNKIRPKDHIDVLRLHTATLPASAPGIPFAAASRATGKDAPPSSPMLYTRYSHVWALPLVTA
jgi:hypothetical protein